jgi:hypothetical protein
MTVREPVICVLPFNLVVPFTSRRNPASVVVPNNKFLVFLGILKYYINKLIQPITKFINNIREHDFFEPIVFILFFGLIIISFFSFLFSLLDIAYPQMCRKGK